MEDNSENIDIEDIEGYESATEEVTEGVNYSENFAEINSNLQKLNDGVESLVQVLTVTEEPTEEPTEEVTEEPTENPVVIALENLDGNVTMLRQELAEYNSEEPTEEPTEEVTEEPTEEPQLVYLGSGTDTHLYLTSQVENADINDVYTMILSTRNILLLFLLVFVAFKFGSMLRDVIARFMNR